MTGNVEVLNLGFVNAYLLKAKDGFVLIDTGMPGQWDTLESLMRSAGCFPGLLKLVVLTHADLDHYGNCVKLKETYKAPIAVHRLDSPVLETGVSPKRTIRTPSRKIMFSLIDLLRRFRRSSIGLTTFTPDVFLEDGQTLDTYGLAAQVIHLPGHTTGSIAVLANDGNFFVGDTYTNRKKPNLSPFIENLGEYRNSVEKVKRLSGSIRTVYPGHGTPFTADLLSSISL